MIHYQGDSFAKTASMALFENIAIFSIVVFFRRASKQTANRNKVVYPITTVEILGKLEKLSVGRRILIGVLVCLFVFICVHLCSFVFICVHLCLFVFLSS